MNVLRNRNFATLLGGQLVSTVGDNLFGIALPWYIYIRTGSKSDLALAGIAQTLPAMAGLATGVFVDRWRKRATMAVSDTLRAALCAVLFVAVLLHEPLWSVLVAVLLLEVVGRFFNPAAGALLPLLVPSDDFAAASGLQQSSGATAQLLGTLSGGALLSALGPALLFASDGASFLVSAASVLLIRVHEPHSAGRGPGRNGASAVSPTTVSGTTVSGTTVSGRTRRFAAEWLDGLQLLQRSKFVRLLVISAVCANFALAPTDLALTAWVKGPLHGSALQLSFLMAALFCGMVAGGFALGPISKHMTLKPVLAAGLICAGTLLASIGIFANLGWSIGLLVCAGLMFGVINGATGAIMMQKIPAQLRGRTFGTLSALTMLAMPLGMALFGVLVTQLTLPWVFAVCGGLCVLSGGLLLLPIPDDLQAIPVSETASESL